MQKSGRLTLFGLLSAIFILFGCRKEKTYWEGDFVGPLAHGNLSLGNIFPDTTIKSNPDSSLKIAFETNVVNYQLDSLLKIPDTTIIVKNTLPIPIKVAVTPCMLVISATKNDNYFPIKNGVQLTQAVIKSGEVIVELSSTIRQPIVYNYTLTAAEKNNVTLTNAFNVPGGSQTVPGVATYTIDLSGYSIDFTGINHNLTNTVEQEYSAMISCSAQNDTVFPNDSILVKYTFKDLVPQYAQGYFGNQSITVGPDTTSFDVFNTIQSGMLNLNSADVKLKIINEFGVAMRATINNLTAMSTPNATTTVLTSTVINSPYNINGAINNGPYLPVTASSKTITLNNSNSNIKDFIGILPDKFSYKLTTQLNPMGNQGGNNDFAYYGTGFKAYLNADIPLYFSASNILLTDTVTLDLSGVTQFKNINYGQLLLTATNSYPFSINLQGYLLDENKNVVDVLFSTPNTIQAPMLDANFKVIAPLQSRLYIPLNKTKLDNLQKARYIRYTSTFNTASQPNQIKFYEHYTLDLLLTADINYTIGK